MTKQWQKNTLRLKKNHNWKAPDGYKIVVLDRGAVSFNVPTAWIVANTEPFEMHDQEPPDDNVRLTVSFWRLPPGVDWSGLPLDEMLEGGMQETKEGLLEQSPLGKVAREDMEMVWAEQRFVDPQEKREAFTRMMLARGWDIQAFMTLDFWVEDADRLRRCGMSCCVRFSLGRSIEDPTRGAVLTLNNGR